MVDYVSLWWHKRPVRALDLACGPGCLAARLLRGLPAADVVGVDVDPWLLEMGRQTLNNQEHMTWIEADLRADNWIEQLPYRSFHAVLTTTALHWFDSDELRRIYGKVGALLVEDGLFLVADVIPAGSPAVQRLARDMLVRWQVGAINQTNGDSWQTFWQAARQEPAFQDLFAERDRRLGARRPRLFLPLDFHSDASVSAGFREFGEVWRCHESAILLAIR